ncbi:hypothetical protein [Gemella massiliensis]|uniref:hypothetical protein n=1 Tax=Gemella massiliensis TaxID=1909670 RepID=UPI00093130C1|nr:hypothetical protein [Gemella massiliensis]
MPNWCEGNLKIRGKKKDLISFFEHEIVIVKFDEILSSPEQIPIKFVNDDMECVFSFSEKNFLSDLYLKKSYRFFIENDVIEFWHDGEESICYVTLDIKQAWDIDVQKILIKHSEKYNVDFNIFACDKGMEFERYVTVISGELVRDEERKYEDFSFEAINPRLGG